MKKRIENISQSSKHLENAARGLQNPRAEERNEQEFTNSFLENPSSVGEASSSSVQYLDLSTSSFAVNVIPKISPNLAVLRLSGIDLSKFSLSSLPQLPKLRTLFLDSCKLSSLSGLPSFHSLRYFNLANNKLQNYMHAPILPQLESIDLSGNECKFTLKSAVSAFGTISLCSFNGQKVTEEQLVPAFQISLLVGYALRQGLPISDLDNVDKANLFLTPNGRDIISDFPKYLEPTIRETEEYTESILPLTYLKATKVKWFVNRQPKDGDEWLEVQPSKEDPLTLSITNFINGHLVKCTFQATLQGKKTIDCTLYTKNVINCQKGTPILPFAINPVVSGDPVEGSLISLIPMAVPVSVTWYQGEEVIAPDTQSLRLEASHIGKPVLCVLEPYCPYHPSIKFAKLFTETGVVQSLIPTIHNLQFPDDIIEGVEIKLNHTCNPDREGDSIITLYRSSSPSGDWKEVEESFNPNALNYIPTFEDIGCYLCLSYTPILEDGETMGNEQRFYSSNRVLPSAPVFTNPRIVGLPTVFHPILALAKYTGGTQGDSVFHWYSSSKKINLARGITSKCRPIDFDGPILELGMELVDRYIICEMIPMRDDDVTGEPVYAQTETPVQESDTDLKKILGLPDILRPATNYQININGCRWFVTDPDTPDGFEPIGGAIGMDCMFDLCYVGKFVRITKKKSDSDELIVDTIAGPIRSDKMFFSSVNISLDGEALPGAIATLNTDNLEGVRYYTVWVRKGKGNYKKVVDIETDEYTITQDDIGYRIVAVVYPVNSDGTRGAPCESNATPKIELRPISMAEIVGNLVEGETISVAADGPIYSAQWRVSRDKRVWKDIDFFEYSAKDSPEDEIYYIRNGKKKDITNEIELTLNNQHVTCYIQAIVQLGEWKDGKKPTFVPSGDPITLNSTSMTKTGYVLPCASQIIFPDDYEEKEYLQDGEELTLKVSGEKKQIEWVYQIEDENSELVWTHLHEGMSYTFTPEDIDATIGVRFVDDEDSIIILKDIVGAPPSVSHVKIQQTEIGLIKITGRYKGGIEGSSKIYVSYLDKDGCTNITQKTPGYSKEFLPPTFLWNKRIDCCYIPVSSDGQEGKPVWSKSAIIVKPLPELREFSIKNVDPATGENDPSLKFKVGRVLIATGIAKNGTCTYEYAWSYQEDDMGVVEYGDRHVLTEEDEDRQFTITCVAVASNGFRSEPWRQVIRLMKPEYDDISVTIEIPARRQTVQPKTNKRMAETFEKGQKAQGDVDTGDELTAVITGIDEEELDDVIISWQRLEGDTWEDIDSADGLQYQTSFCDMGYQIRCVLQVPPEMDHPEDEDKEPDVKIIESSPVGPVSLDPVLESTARAVIRANSLKFNASAVVGNGKWEVSMNSENVVIKSLKSGQVTPLKWETTKINAVPGTTDQLEIVTGPQSRFVVVPTPDGRIGKQFRDYIAYIFMVYKLRAIARKSSEMIFEASSTTGEFYEIKLDQQGVLLVPKGRSSKKFAIVAPKEQATNVNWSVVQCDPAVWQQVEGEKPNGFVQLTVAKGKRIIIKPAFVGSSPKVQINDVHAANLMILFVQAMKEKKSK